MRSKPLIKIDINYFFTAVEHRDNTACLSFYAKQVRYSMKESIPNFFSEVDGLLAEDEPDFGDEIDDPNYIPPKALSAVAAVPHITMEWVRYRNVAISKTGKKIYSFRNKQIHHRVRECSRALDLLEALQAGKSRMAETTQLPFQAFYSCITFFRL